MGYSGHGTQMSVHMGERMAAVMDGDVLASPWEGRDWPAITGHLGPPWFCRQSASTTRSRTGWPERFFIDPPRGDNP
jgi:hypothetical protein